jgi:uncharacterized protein YkwD
MPAVGQMNRSAATTSPVSMRRLRIAAAALALSILTIVATAAPAFGWASSQFSTSDEQLLFSLTNQDRASAGLNPLVNDSYLHKKAEWRAKDMGDRNFFSHTIPPSNKMVFYYMQLDHYCFKVAGENIGLSTYGDDVATNRIETAFMNSKTHRENILGTWGRMGVGAYKAADGRKIYAVLFSLPCSSAKPKPKATTKLPVSTPFARATAKPTASPSASATPLHTIEPTLAPVAPAATPTSSATAPPAPTVPDPTEQVALTLRVHEKAPSQGPLDSLFRMFFGGLFG